ncbi:hypothetical protein CC80DRAFT_101726 [Byssothecium circinans]|uniref:Uncharacterized protein n=1 Tax=Byssothecium circinans TaxID=147558 RepID=A0A6A5UJ68_9PLEO|nr:hypothetical protein CC80DRAFT_101726 [Byssothecium circinans]
MAPSRLEQEWYVVEVVSIAGAGAGPGGAVTRLRFMVDGWGVRQVAGEGRRTKTATDEAVGDRTSVGDTAASSAEYSRKQ